ncbi:hypothetical protein MsAc7_17330 [Methanolapillus millepedarum]|uniref:Uncharacterized protein n=2 Tax=Methanolapillus millepedarum TaxID=3028296 RepID=A0AA96V627_9EURY|nr:hypothetical protein MsAc7_17330 [Methanosarcinaceae archaeon Ac7]
MLSAKFESIDDDLCEDERGEDYWKRSEICIYLGNEKICTAVIDNKCTPNSVRGFRQNELDCVLRQELTS